MNKPFFQSKKMLLAAAASLAVAGCGGAATEKSAKPERPSTPYSTAESEDLNPPPAAAIAADRAVAHRQGAAGKIILCNGQGQGAEKEPHPGPEFLPVDKIDEAAARIVRNFPAAVEDLPVELIVDELELPLSQNIELKMLIVNFIQGGIIQGAFRRR